MPFWRRDREEPRPRPEPEVDEPVDPELVDPAGSPIRPTSRTRWPPTARSRPSPNGSRRPSPPGRSCSPVWSSRSRSTSPSRNPSRPSPPPSRPSRSRRRPNPRHPSPSPTRAAARRRSRADPRRLHVAAARLPRPAAGEGPSWDDVEETLIAGDVGAALAIDLVERARAGRDPAGPEAADPGRARRAARPARPRTGARGRRSPGGPAVVLVVGVNGTGKTTTIGKLASRYAAEGRSVILAAADTFRAAAIDQLRIWADRAEVPMVAHAPGADPGAVVYDALDAAVARGADLVIADTAGRLHTKSNLMDELSKIRRIIDKRLPGAEPETLVRARRHDRPERPRPGQGLPRGGRADRDRPDQARFDGQGRDRLRHRGRAQDPGPLRRRGGEGRRPASRSTPTRSWRRSSPRPAASAAVALDLRRRRSSGRRRRSRSGAAEAAGPARTTGSRTPTTPPSGASHDVARRPITSARTPAASVATSWAILDATIERRRHAPERPVLDERLADRRPR